MADGDGVSSWASLVPEVYFDLIARIPAGATIILVIVSYFASPKTCFALLETWPDVLTAGNFGPVLGLILFFILASYVLGLMLTLPSGLVAYASRWLVWFTFIKVLNWYPDLNRLLLDLGFLSSEEVVFRAGQNRTRNARVPPT